MSMLRRAASAVGQVWRRVLAMVGAGLLIALIGAWAVTLRPISMGGPAEYVVIHGNSMFPLYHDGDLILSHSHAAYAVGDVVAYRVPQGQLGQGLVVIHRIVGGSAASGFVLKGDNNPITDPWHPRGGDIVGSTWVRIPRLGKLFVAIHRPIVPGVFFGVLALIVVLRWQHRSTPAPAVPAAPEDDLPTADESLDPNSAELEGRPARPRATAAG
jgi:signal peptidase